MVNGYSEVWFWKLFKTLVAENWEKINNENWGWWDIGGRRREEVGEIVCEKVKMLLILF